MTLVTAMSRECVLKSYLSFVKEKYDYVLIDCMPSLGMIMAAYVGVSYTALLIRLRELDMLEYHDISEYISTELNLGGGVI